MRRLAASQGYVLGAQIGRATSSSQTHSDDQSSTSSRTMVFKLSNVLLALWLFKQLILFFYPFVASGTLCLSQAGNINLDFKAIP